MLNTSVRREAIEKLDKAVKRHKSIGKKVERASVRLFEQRQHAAGEVIQRVEGYVNLLANSPKEFDKSVAQYRIEVDRFDEVVQHLEVEAVKTTKVGSAVGTAGAAAGVGVAAMGPTALMAVATTFGTASTGTAISALSGAAATNAAIAWLGGGAIAAGGGGMVLGKTVLFLTGPIGWTIGGLAVAGSVTYLHKRNKKFAGEATEQRIKVEAEIRSLRTVNREIKGFEEQTKVDAEGCTASLDWLVKQAPEDYLDFNMGQKERLAALINHIRSLSVLLNTEVVYGQA